MTKQEYKDLLILTSASGGFPAVEGGSCRYRTPDGMKCAVGLLILDEKYDPRWDDGRGVRCADLPREALDFPDGVGFTALIRLQAAHDRLAPNWDHEAFVESVTAILG